MIAIADFVLFGKYTIHGSTVKKVLAASRPSSFNAETRVVVSTRRKTRAPSNSMPQRAHYGCHSSTAARLVTKSARIDGEPALHDRTAHARTARLESPLLHQEPLVPRVPHSRTIEASAFCNRFVGFANRAGADAAIVCNPCAMASNPSHNGPPSCRMVGIAHSCRLILSLNTSALPGLLFFVLA